MSEETIHTAARRVVRFFNIDMNKGGIIDVQTQQAIETLDFQVRREDARLKREAANKEAQAAITDSALTEMRA